MELNAILKDKLNAGDNVVAVHTGVLLQGWSPKAHRLLSLVERNSSFGLFVFTTSRNPPQAFTDLTINFVVPIDSDFNCDIDSLSADSNSDIYLNISARNLKLLMGMNSSYETNHFFNELSKAMDLYLKNEGTLNFQWLKKYNISDIDLELGMMMNINGDTTQNNLKITPNMVMSENDLSFPSGTHPHSSRESVIQRQMILSEEQYTNAENFSIYIGTWNVNGQPASSSLNDWLTCDHDPPDIYAIGFQELDLSKEAFLFNDSSREEEWL